MPRVGPPDIGAFESQGFTLTISGGTDQSTPIGTPFASPLTVTVTANNAVEPVSGGAVFFNSPQNGGIGPAAIMPAQATIVNGIASVMPLANLYSGAYQVTAYDLESNPVVFNLLNDTMSSSSAVSWTGTAVITTGTPR